MSEKGSTKVEMSYVKVVTEFFPALNHLGQLSVNNIDALIAITKTKKIAKEKAQEFTDMRTKLIQDSCEKDANGKPIIDETNSYKFANDKIKAETNKLLVELENKKVKLDITPINISVLQGVEGLTANTLEALEDFLITE
jgi:aspartate-semialdehyde dehydrogenase